MRANSVDVHCWVDGRLAQWMFNVASEHPINTRMKRTYQLPSIWKTLSPRSSFPASVPTVVAAVYVEIQGGGSFTVTARCRQSTWNRGMGSRKLFRCLCREDSSRRKGLVLFICHSRPNFFRAVRRFALNNVVTAEHRLLLLASLHRDQLVPFIYDYRWMDLFQCIYLNTSSSFGCYKLPKIITHRWIKLN